MTDIRKRVEQAVESWFDAHVRNSVIARFTGAYNHLMNIKTHLVDKVVEGLEGIFETAEKDAVSEAKSVEGDLQPESTESAKA